MLGNQASLPLVPSHIYTVEAPTFLFTTVLEISIFTSENMDRDGLTIGVLVSLHDAGLAWWTQDEVLQERTAVSIVIHVHCFEGGGNLLTNIYPSS